MPPATGDLNPDSEAHITPHSHEDLHDEKLQQQNPAAHYESEDPRTQTGDAGTGGDGGQQKNGKHENGKQQPAGGGGGKKQENGKANDSKTNTPV